MVPVEVPQPVVLMGVAGLVLVGVEELVRGNSIVIKELAAFVTVEAGLAGSTHAGELERQKSSRPDPKQACDGPSRQRLFRTHLVRP